MGVGCKLVQFVVFCVLFVMILTNIKKKLSCFSGGTCLDSLWLFAGRKLGQYADQERAFEIPFPENFGLTLKYILIQVHDQQGQQ